jgi:hypothetical protein
MDSSYCRFLLCVEVRHIKTSLVTVYLTVAAAVPAPREATSERSERTWETAPNAVHTVMTGKSA